MRNFRTFPLWSRCRANRPPQGGVHRGWAPVYAASLLLAGSPAQSALAGPQSGTRIGWGYDSAPSSDFDCPQSCFSNATKRGTIVFDHLGTGSYEIEMSFLYKAEPSNVQISSAYANAPSYCNTSGWSAGESKSVDIFVNCYNAKGKLRDTVFSFLYQSRSRTLGSNKKGTAFLWADQPTEASYTPNLGYQYNSAGATNTIVRNGTGSYTALVPGLTKNGGNVQVTAYGNSPARCKVSSWSADQSGTSVNVLCFDSAGATADEMFTLAYTIGEPMGIWRTEANFGDTGAYVWADKPSKIDIYTPRHPYNYSGFKAGDLTVQRNSEGYYTITVPGFDLFSGAAALVTAMGSTNDYCTVGNSDLGWMPITVYCFDQDGNRADSKFNVLLQTDVKN